MIGCMHEFVRRAYYGGRCERFRESFNYQFLDGTVQTIDSEARINYGDINSMYPWAMMHDVPTELVYVHNGPLDIEKHSKFHLGFIECTVEVPVSCYIPPLPHRYNEKLLFPVGTFSGVWTSLELLALLSVGGKVVKFERSAWFRGQKVFTEYVEHWYQFRNKKSKDYSPAMDVIAKLFLNSLYGKMGMNVTREKLWFFPTEEDLQKHKMVPMLGCPFGTFIEETESDPVYVIPHIAAWITSRARVRLWELLYQYHTVGHSVFYVDTDSIFTSGAVQNSTTLGDLKLEAVIDLALFVAPKMYFYRTIDGKETVKAKGFTSGFGVKGMTIDEFVSIVNRHRKAKIARMRKLREGLRTGMRYPAMHHLEKGVKGKGLLDEKRVLLNDGNTKAVELCAA